MRRALGAVMLLGALVTGCAAPAAPASAPAPVEAAITITDGRAVGVGPRLEVALGGELRLAVLSDTADELHVHGYDRTLTLTPGAPATLDMTADVPGVFEIELHGAGTVVTSLLVR